MDKWKSHVRAGLFNRDCIQKDPFAGVFNKLSHLAERLELQETFWEARTNSCADDGGEGAAHGGRLQLDLREGEHLREKLSQTIADLTSVLYLKEAELLYWQSQVSRYRKEAVTMATGAGALQASLSDCEFTLESQSKELEALRLEQRELREGLSAAWREKEELLQRWVDEKRGEAERVNAQNDVQERWHRLTRRLDRRHRREMVKWTGLPPHFAGAGDGPSMNPEPIAVATGSRCSALSTSEGPRSPFQQGLLHLKPSSAKTLN